MAPEIGSDEAAIFEQQLLALAKENDMKNASTLLEADTNQKLGGPTESVEDMVKGLLGALKRENRNPSDSAKQSIVSGPEGQTSCLTAGGCTDAVEVESDVVEVESVMMSSSAGDADLAKLLQTLGNALNNPEGKTALVQKQSQDSHIECNKSGKETILHSPVAAGYNDARRLEPVVAVAGPSHAKPAKCEEVLGTAFNKPEEQKVLAEVPPKDIPNECKVAEPIIVSSGPTDADFAKLVGALGNALSKPNERQALAQVQTKESLEECKQVAPVMVSSGPSDADIAKLVGALGNALSKPEERKTLAAVQPKDAAHVEPVKTLPGPAAADLQKLMGAFGDALGKPKVHEVEVNEADMLIPTATEEDDLFRKQLLALAAANEALQTQSPNRADAK